MSFPGNKLSYEKNEEMKSRESENAFSFANEYTGVSQPKKKSFLKSFKEGIQKSFNKDEPSKVKGYQLVTHESRYRTEEGHNDNEMESIEMLDDFNVADMIHSIMNIKSANETPNSSNTRNCDKRTPDTGALTNEKTKEGGNNLFLNLPITPKNVQLDEKKCAFIKTDKTNGKESPDKINLFSLSPDQILKTNNPSRLELNKSRQISTKTTFRYTKDLIESYRISPVNKKPGSKWGTARKVFRALGLDNK